MRQFPPTLAIFLCTCLAASRLAGESTEGAAVGRPVPAARLVILGDSITAGYGLDREQAYPALLQERFAAAAQAVEVANAGVSGDTTAGGSRRVAWALGPRGADALVIALGGNDGLRGLSPAQTEANLLAIIRQARERSPGIHILLSGMEMPDNMGPDYQREFAALFPKVAREAKVELLPFLLVGVGGDPERNQDDRIHPNEAGQRVIAGTVWQALQPWAGTLARKAAKGQAGAAPPP
jgi:acyl-CoA thioesterase I